MYPYFQEAYSAFVKISKIYFSGLQNGQRNFKPIQLCGYITQQLKWLGVCVYVEIEKENENKRNNMNYICFGGFYEIFEKR